MISPFVVWLCTDAASGVNGRSFYVSGGRVSLLTEPKSAKTINHDGAWMNRPGESGGSFF